MARRARDDAPGAAHHVMLRGIERRAIFADDRDREDFLRRLSVLVPDLGFRCFAWALMPNHVHLVLRSGQPRISQLMARLGTGYARRFNERHDRVGHLFQNRFRSRRASGEADLMGLVLYVTRNPLAGGLVGDARELERFPWCGLGSLTGHRAPRPFEAVSEALALFDPDPSAHPDACGAGSRVGVGVGVGVGVDPTPWLLRRRVLRRHARTFAASRICSARCPPLTDSPRRSCARGDVHHESLPPGRRWLRRRPRGWVSAVRRSLVASACRARRSR